MIPNRRLAVGVLSLSLWLFGCSKAVDNETLDTQALGLSLFPRSIQIPTDIQLQDEEGKDWTPALFQGQWNLVFFGYTFCPDICPTTLMELNKVYKALSPALQQQFQVWLVSVDPDRDKQMQLKPYVEYFNASFKALTGESSEIAKLARALNMIYMKVEQEQGPYLMDHSAGIVLINPKGEYVGFFGAPQQFEHMPKALIGLGGL
jgi:protein SCO1/2